MWIKTYSDTLSNGFTAIYTRFYVPKYHDLPVLTKNRASKTVVGMVGQIGFVNMFDFKLELFSLLSCKTTSIE